MKKTAPLLLLAALALCLLPGCRMTMDDFSKAFSLAEKHADKLGKATEEFTPEQEYYLGRAVAAQIIQKYPATKDDKANTYLNQVGQALALCSKQPYTYGGYHFLLLDSGEVNAFAAPDGLIFVTKGMLGLISGESELAAVLAHEIAHVQNKDAVRAIAASRLTEAAILLGRDAAGRYGSVAPQPQLLALFTGSVDDIVAALISRGYSRDQEYAADAGAKEILAMAGYSPHALGSVLEALKKRVPAGSSGFGSTHPSPADRLGALKATAAPAGREPEARARRFTEALGKYRGPSL